MSQYQRPCSFCKQEIRMSDNSGQWLPYNLDSSFHQCKKSEQKQQQSQFKITLSLESLDQKVTKLQELVDSLGKQFQLQSKISGQKTG